MKGFTEIVTFTKEFPHLAMYVHTGRKIQTSLTYELYMHGNDIINVINIKITKQPLNNL